MVTIQEPIRYISTCLELPKFLVVFNDYSLILMDTFGLSCNKYQCWNIIFLLVLV